MEPGQEQALPPFFSRIRRRFEPVPADERIQVGPFLMAAREVLDLLDLFGMFLKPVKTDINANITALQVIYDTDPDKLKTFNDMLAAEGDSNTGAAYVALLWLKRALDFLSNFIILLLEDHRKEMNGESLSQVSRQAYERSLQQYHNFIVRNISRILLRLIPSRTSLNRMLCGSDQLTPQALTDMEVCEGLLEKNLEVINRLFPVEERN